MTTVSQSLLVLAGALVVDRLLGEPAWLWSRLPHPVVLAGRLIARLDAGLNRDEKPFGTRRRRGVAAVMLLAAAAALAGWIAAEALRAVPGGALLEALLVSVLLAHKSLMEHVEAVAAALRTAGIEPARRAVARIVGRDVAALDEPGVARAAIESLAENFSDGLVAPAFWYALLGLPGLLVFKAVSTADSMIGHRSRRHEAFGWAAARLDDAMNYLPARISALLLALAALIARQDAGGALAAIRADAGRHRSPNAGWPEAAAAGALGLALGGPRRYGDTLVDGAWLNGGGRREAGADVIRRALQLADAAWLLLLLAVALSGLALWR